MSRTQAFVVVMCAAFIVRAPAAQSEGAASPAAPVKLSERQKIEALIQVVAEMKDAKFIRNNKEYDGAAAANHMRTKWNAAKGKVRTATEFIEGVASTSSVSGKPYMIRFNDGREMTSAEFLTAALRNLEQSPTVPSSVSAADPNPAAPGFHDEDSDARAVQLADLTMLAMGGRKAWDDTRIITWNFFGRRRLVWDKHTGDVRIESGTAGGDDHSLVLVNIVTKRGRAWKAGTEITDADELATTMQDGWETWVNDGYWLFMPYKLKDSGVTLKYVGEGATEDGRDADIIQMTFADVGVTPHNKYQVWIARDDHLVAQWAYYEKASDETPKFTSPWKNWRPFGTTEIKLSDERGERNGKPMKLTDIAVFDELPKSVFTSPSPVDWSAMSANTADSGK
jgi:hypothetical protein